MTNDEQTNQAAVTVNSPFGIRHSSFRRYWSVYITLLRNSIIREMSFKTNFLLWIVVELLWFALQLTFIAVVYSHTERIGDWTKWEVVLLIGTAHFIQQIFQAFFLTNCTELSELIRTGRLDFILLLPVNTRFLISLRKVDLGSFINAGCALAVIGYSLNKLALVPSALQIVGFLLFALTGIAIHYSLMFLLTTVSFWTVRAQGIIWGYYSLFNISRLPDAAYRGVFKAVFTFVIPMILVANVPAKVMVSKLQSPSELVLLVVMMLVCAIVSEIGWRFSVRHYTSASS
ncbi:MAG TPA: ABC-2 family transporter protein [Candidatus Limnocylindria bacterium]|nr:ABC-2 family transporter protein [Candidatus Limnocylindria bacterium]